jgi:uncharacterized protein (DUF2236 family)
VTSKHGRPRLLPEPLPAGIPGDPGWFGPGSEVWRVMRERLLLLGGPAALLLQLAHPLVAAGVAAHSSFRDDPLRRLRATLDTTLTITFGDHQQALAAAARVRRRHRRVQGHLPAGVGRFPAGTVYSAGDPELALWVHATLVVVALQVMDQFVSPLSLQQRVDYYRQSKPFALLFGVTEEVLPDTHADFEAYVRRMVEGPDLAVDRTARDLATAVFDNWLLGLPHPPAAATKVITAGLLPARFQQAFGLPWGLREQCGYTVLRHALRLAAPALPPALRFWPHHAAAARRAAEASRSSGRSARATAVSR